jgi:lipoate-protein ligase A
MSTEEFKKFIFHFQLKKEKNRLYVISENESKSIQNLATEKFSTWEWNFGYSPKYTFQKNAVVNGKSFSVKLKIKNGKIEDCELGGNWLATNDLLTVSSKLVGKKHCFEEIEKIFAGTSEEFINTFF